MCCTQLLVRNGDTFVKHHHYGDNGIHCLNCNNIRRYSYWMRRAHCHNFDSLLCEMTKFNSNKSNWAERNIEFSNEKKTEISFITNYCYIPENILNFRPCGLFQAWLNCSFISLVCTLHNCKTHSGLSVPNCKVDLDKLILCCTIFKFSGTHFIYKNFIDNDDTDPWGIIIVVFSENIRSIFNWLKLVRHVTET